MTPAGSATTRWLQAIKEHTSWHECMAGIHIIRQFLTKYDVLQETGVKVLVWFFWAFLAWNWWVPFCAHVGVTIMGAGKCTAALGGNVLDEMAARVQAARMPHLQPVPHL